MGAITIRNVAETLVSAIKRKAAEHGVSMEERPRMGRTSA
jgi:plasmid stability protein